MYSIAYYAYNYLQCRLNCMWRIFLRAHASLEIAVLERPVLQFKPTRDISNAAAEGTKKKKIEAFCLAIFRNADLVGAMYFPVRRPSARFIWGSVPA